MRHRLYIHLTWTTRDRRPLITLPAAEYLAAHLEVIAYQERARILAIGIVSTHLHLLVRIHPTVVLPKVLQRMKGATAVVARRDHGIRLEWAKGYNADSVSERAVDQVAHYVVNQHQRHPLEAIPGWPRDRGARG